MNVEIAVQRLCDAGVEFVVIGGWAAIFHGSVYITNDLDICYSRDKENLRKLAEALAPYHPRPREFPDTLPFVWDAATLGSGSVYTLTTDLGIIGLLAEVSGIGTYADGRVAGLLPPEELPGRTRSSSAESPRPINREGVRAVPPPSECPRAVGRGRGSRARCTSDPCIRFP